MEIAFETRALRTICETEEHANTQLGAATAAALRRRLADLRAARSVEDLIAGSPRQLAEGNMMVLDIQDGVSLVFSANHFPARLTPGGQQDWRNVSRIKILRIGGDDAQE